MMGHTQRQLDGQAPYQANSFQADRVWCQLPDMSHVRHRASGEKSQSNKHQTKHTTANKTASTYSQWQRVPSWGRVEAGHAAGVDTDDSRGRR